MVVEEEEVAAVVEVVAIEMTVTAARVKRKRTPPDWDLFKKCSAKSLFDRF